MFLLPAATARSGGQGGAQVPAGAPLQHTALRKIPWKKTVEAFDTLRGALRAQERQPMQIDLDTGEILEDGSDEELAEWVQLYRATRENWTPYEPHDETCPF